MLGYEAWLAKASSDFRSAVKLAKDVDDTLDTAAYHTQQCVEKALKAFLVFSGKAVPKTHDLETLLNLCAQKQRGFKNFLDDVIELMPYATYSRYPDDRFFIERGEIEAAIRKADAVLKFVKRVVQVDPNVKVFDE